MRASWASSVVAALLVATFAVTKAELSEAQIDSRIADAWSKAQEDRAAYRVLEEDEVDGSTNETDFLARAKASVSARIIGGTLADPSDRSWMVALITYVASGKSYKEYLCGGNYVGSANGYHFVVTAAHCLANSISKAYAFFDLDNLNDLGSDSDAYYLSSYYKKFVNSDFDSTNIINDIGIIVFTDENLQTTTPATLAGSGMSLEVGENVTVTGYGLTSYAKQTDKYDLREVTLQIISDTKCQSIYTKGGVTTDMDVEVCAMSTGKGSCSGDSGGPLIATRNSEEVVVGLVSWGIECADTEPTYPDVYTRVSAFQSWVTKKVENVCGTSSFLQFYNTTAEADSKSFNTVSPSRAPSASPTVASSIIPTASPVDLWNETTGFMYEIGDTIYEGNGRALLDSPSQASSLRPFSLVLALCTLVLLAL
mmetsp:Transcript_4213/g.9130  ORF Transcript_4213/g.9130 Transcript_4213/m.9130 type:complete len:425 (-) Transcript_4213:304-1578(-)|eukprot:CAMPEP_0171488296 /NCGR_PEP_ID=MMETSP0958-20121227/2128_1 /TAXON_ID=87120 /ORGANISM="Aurantiochytrium limacinum, Strain ATCCMYA-1381" /LENGTH=424 /DNA_ID=CAMNT_0012021393 /DNA_START=109 /DNA_END=1383 /DNA_ORIENTATION=+